MLEKALLGSIIGCCLIPTVVFAQTPPQPPPPAATPSTPPPVQVHSLLNIGVNIAKGVTDQVGVTVSGAVLRRSPLWDLALEGDEAYSQVSVQGIDQTVADAQNLKFTANRNLTPRTYLMVRPAYKRNSVQSVDYRFEELAGYGVRLADTAPNGRLQINVVPVAGAVEQKKNIPDVDGAHAAAGGFESVVYQLKPGWTFNHFFIYLLEFHARQDFRLQTTNALVGAITQHIGLNISYSVDHESIVLAGENSDDHRLSFGLSLTL